MSFTSTEDVTDTSSDRLTDSYFLVLSRCPHDVKMFKQQNPSESVITRCVASWRSSGEGGANFTAIVRAEERRGADCSDKGLV